MRSHLTDKLPELEARRSQLERIKPPIHSDAMRRWLHDWNTLSAEIYREKKR